MSTMHGGTDKVPYTTKTGIKIGLLYTPPLPQPSADDELIQRVLLKDRSVFTLTHVMDWTLYGILVFFTLLIFFYMVL